MSVRTNNPVPETPNRGEVRSVARAGALLNAVVDSPGGLNLTDLSTTTGLNISTVHRLLRTLCSEGMLCRDPETERFLPGPMLTSLARRSLSATGLPEVAEALRTLVDTTGETSSLVLRRGQESVVMLSTPSLKPFRYEGEPGLRRPLSSCAPGLAILAFGEEPLERAAEEAAAGTPEPEEAARELHMELLTTQFRGFATVDDLDTPGLRAVAVPVWTKGRVLAAVEVQGPSARLGDERLQEAVDALGHAARQLQDLPLSLALVRG